MMGNIEMPLRCELVDGTIRIQVGSNVLAFATENHPELQDEEAEPRCRVTDPAEWMKSVKLALDSEEEDGTTLVHKMLDAAIMRALEQGYEGVDEIPPKKPKEDG